MTESELTKAQEAHEAMLSYAERVAAEEVRLADEFMCAALTASMDSPASFAPWVKDYSLPKRADGSRYERPLTIGEALYDSLDLANGPQLNEAFAILALAAKGECIKARAMDLLTRMASKWAAMNAEVE